MTSAEGWAAYEPGNGRPWDLALAGHLLRRAGFGGAWRDLQQALADGPSKTVARLLAPPAEFEAWNARVDALADPILVSDAAGSAPSAELWLYRMLATPYPALEKMALFWHGHFAVAGAQAGRSAFMERHVRLLRRHALGRFDAMLREICRDPATLVACGARASRKPNPAEGFASALLRHYTVGTACTPADVKEAARAFTGRAVLASEFRYLAQEHDAGVKTVLGNSGNFDGEEVVRILLAHPATPRRIVRKLYRWLVSETDAPADALIDPLAESFARDYDIAKVAGTMLRSNLFFSAAAYRQRVKSPVEFGVGLARALELQAAPAALHRQLGGLGQTLLEPPVRDGWAGGRRWLNRYTAAARANAAAALAAKADARALAEKHGRGGAAGRFLLELLLQGDGSEAPAAAIAASPEYQLS